MKIKLKVEGIDVEFKIDTGFEGECMLCFEIFNRIDKEEFDGPTVVTADSNRYRTKAKRVSITFNDKNFMVDCIYHQTINKNLLGEKALIKLGIVLNYKENKILDP